MLILMGPVCEKSICSWICIYLRRCWEVGFGRDQMSEFSTVFVRCFHNNDEMLKGILCVILYFINLYNKFLYKKKGLLLMDWVLCFTYFMYFILLMD